MAGLNLCVNWIDVALASGSYKTMCAIKAGADQMVRIKSIWQSSAGIAGDAEPLSVRLCRIVADSGTGTGTTPQKLNNALTATPRSTCRNNFTVEPTESGTAPYIFPHKSHPQGASSKECSFDDVFVNEDTEIAVQIKLPSGGAINNTGHVIIEE